MVALAGGVFGNVRLNQAIASLDEIDKVYVFPAMGDEGLGLGAALHAAANRAGGLQPFRLPTSTSASTSPTGTWRRRSPNRIWLRSGTTMPRSRPAWPICSRPARSWRCSADA